MVYECDGFRVILGEIPLASTGKHLPDVAWPAARSAALWAFGRRQSQNAPEEHSIFWSRREKASKYYLFIVFSFNFIIYSLVQGLRDWILGLPRPKSSHDLSKLKSSIFFRLADP